MDLRVVTSLLSVMLAAVLNTVVSAPASEVPAASLVSHVRNKRCSCATFLDHECVYFCHLDIIWVNTPERIVSYGLGNMPRRRRSAGVPPAKSHGGARCRCLKGNDSACNNFCQPEHQLRQNKTSLGKKIRRAEGERCSGAGCARTPRMKRRTNGENMTKTPSLVALRAVAQTRGVLEAWRTRRWRRAAEEGHVAS
ncbi:endothelin-1 [Gadus macrocephalus]|uniref:endothelin-1 n=1 Tax=Gadus macrocephalus TaxID=80720 RepID=UPI0028CB2BEE|nr:endothelin-1 [Gadus macrocephalus]